MTLPERAPVVLIGANNACKSTILNAVALALGGPSFYNFTPGKFDFFHDTAGQSVGSFAVTVAFAAAQENQFPAVRGGIGNPVAVHGIRVSGSVDKNSRYSHEARLLDKDNKPILLPSGVPLQGETKKTWKESQRPIVQATIRALVRYQRSSPRRVATAAG